MFSSLRSRLWFSYVLLIAVVLTVVGIALFWGLVNNPAFYRQSVLRIRLAEAELAPQIEALYSANQMARLETQLSREASARSLRLALLRSDGKVIMDSGEKDAGLLPVAKILKNTQPDALRSAQFRDEQKRIWFYTLRAVSADSSVWLVVAVARPQLQVMTILRDEMVEPIVNAGMVALVLAFGLGLWMANSITRPLHKMAEAAKNLANGAVKPIPVQGAREVRELAEALNDMSQQVQASQQSQRDFVANVSHELKTPLTSIQGFAQAILDGTAQSAEDLKQAAGVIYNESGRMHRLVLDLLSLARLEAGTADLRRAPLNLTLVLNAVVEKFVLQARQAQISLVSEIADLPVLVGDGDRLAQVFTNLVDNALKFTPPGGSVRVSAQLEQGFALVRVNDSGPGIQPEDQERIFERFYQVDKSRRGGNRRGVGLGLPIARQIVLAHHGEIWAESKPGTGSTFMVKLPLVRPDDSTLVQRKGDA